MTRKRTIDMAMVREARERLEALAKAHPELVGPPSDENRAGWEGELADLMDEGSMGKKQTSIWLEDEMWARLEKAAKRLEEEMPGPRWTRAAALRYLLKHALDEFERQHAEKDPK